MIAFVRKGEYTPIPEHENIELPPIEVVATGEREKEKVTHSCKEKIVANFTNLKSKDILFTLFSGLVFFTFMHRNFSFQHATLRSSEIDSPVEYSYSTPTSYPTTFLYPPPPAPEDTCYNAYYKHFGQFQLPHFKFPNFAKFFAGLLRCIWSFVYLPIYVVAVMLYFFPFCGKLCYSSFLHQLCSIIPQ